MRRKSWFEFHDHPRFPAFLRDLVTDGLEAMWNDRHFYQLMLPLLQQVMRETGDRRIIDLCSGGGGPWLSLARCLHGDGEDGPQILLTDRYPNQRAFLRVHVATGGAVQSYPDPVDAKKIPMELDGIRTIFSSFHHFDPEEARAILQDAVDRRQAIAVFELAKPSVRTILAVSVVPLLTWKLALRIRPFRWSRLFLTYCLPIIPFILWIDGVLSCLRAYSQEDMEELVSGLDSAEGFRWDIDTTKTGRVGVAYLIGYPLPEPEDELPSAEEQAMAQIEMPA